MTNEIKTRLLPRNLFELLEDVSATIGPITITAKAGYVTDFAGIPSALHWWIRPTDRRVARAAIVHDWLYHTHETPRVIADAIFQVVLRQDKTPRRKAKLMSFALWLFGKRAFMTGPEKMLKRTPHLEHCICETNKIEYLK